MHTTFTTKTILSLILVPGLLLSSALLTACSGSGGLGITLGGDNDQSGGGTTALNSNLLLILLVLVVIVAVVALGSLGKK